MDNIGNRVTGQLPLGDAFGGGYVVSMPPVSSKRTEVGNRIWQAMKAKGESLADLARAFKQQNLPIRSVGGLRYMMEQADRYDERVISALCERYGHTRSFWFTGVEEVAPPERSVARLGAYITGTFMEEVRQTIEAEVRQRLDAEWRTLLEALDREDPDAAQYLRHARELVQVRAAGEAAIHPGPPAPPLPGRAPIRAPAA